MADTVLEICREVIRAAKSVAHELGHEVVDTEHLIAGLAQVALPGLLPTLDDVRRALEIVNPARPGVLIFGAPPISPHIAKLGRTLLEWAAMLPRYGEADLRRLVHSEILRYIEGTDEGHGRALLLVLRSSAAPGTSFGGDRR